MLLFAKSIFHEHDIIVQKSLLAIVNPNSNFIIQKICARKKGSKMAKEGNSFSFFFFFL